MDIMEGDWSMQDLSVNDNEVHLLYLDTNKAMGRCALCFKGKGRVSYISFFSGSVIAVLREPDAKGKILENLTLGDIFSRDLLAQRHLDFIILNINLFNGRIFHEDKAVNIELILKAIATFLRSSND